MVETLSEERRRALSFLLSCYSLLTTPYSHLQPFNRECQDDGCSVAFLAFNAYLAMVLFDHLFALKQANTQAGFL